MLISLIDEYLASKKVFTRPDGECSRNLVFNPDDGNNDNEVYYDRFSRDAITSDISFQITAT